MTTSSVSPAAAAILAQAQACIEHMDDTPQTLELETQLMDRIGELMNDDPDQVLPEAMAQGTTAANTLTHLVWSYAECLEWAAQDGAFEQQMFVLPILVAADQRVPGFVKDAADPTAFEDVMAALKRSGLVHRDATVWMVPYCYQTDALDALTPSEVFSINRAGFKDVQTFAESGGVSFDPTEPVWHFNSGDQREVDGTTLQLRYLIGGVVDVAGRANSIVATPRSEAEETRQTEKVMRWSKAAMKAMVKLFKAQEVFVMSPIRFCFAVSEGLTMHNAVGFATTLDYHLATHHLDRGDVECDVQFTTDTPPVPGEKPDPMDVVSLLLDVYDKDGEPNDPPIFQYTWTRPGDDPNWIEIAVQEVVSSGVSLRDPDKPSAPRPGTYNPLDEFDQVDAATIARAAPAPRRLQ